MKLGAYIACLHDKPVAEALQVLRDLGLFSSAGITLTALNCNGNPLDPNPPRSAPGTPRTSATRSSWGAAGRQAGRHHVRAPRLRPRRPLPLVDGAAGAQRLPRRPRHQWNEVGIPFWKNIQARARDADVKLCIEMHRSY